MGRLLDGCADHKGAGVLMGELGCALNPRQFCPGAKVNCERYLVGTGHLSSCMVAMHYHLTTITLPLLRCNAREKDVEN
jgi:hypothetical protein